jgi:hypothetical protein
MRLERNVQVDSRARGRMTVVLPLLRNGVPRMLHPHVVPTGREGVGKTSRSGGEDGQHGQPMHCWQGPRNRGEDEYNDDAEEKTIEDRSFYITSLFTGHGS